MKNILFFLFFLPLIVSGQKIDSTISKAKFEFGKLDCNFGKISEAGKSDYYYLSCTFQNMEYKSITDIGDVYITNQKDLDSLISDLSKAIGYLDAKQKVRFDRKNYSLSVGDMVGKNVFIYDGDKYTCLIKANAQKFLAWLRTIKFPY